jgi:hypothetical protein
MVLHAIALQEQFYWMRANKKNVFHEKLGSTRYVSESRQLMAPSG